MELHNKKINNKCLVFLMKFIKVQNDAIANIASVLLTRLNVRFLNTNGSVQHCCLLHNPYFYSHWQHHSIYFISDIG